MAYVSSPRVVPPADFIIRAMRAIDRYVRASRFCIADVSVSRWDAIDAARYIERWMCNSIYKSAYGNGEIKSLSGFRILISRFAVAVPSITFVGNFHVNIVVYVSICMIHCSVTVTCKNKIFILRSRVSIAYIVSHMTHTYNTLFVF